MGSTAETKSSTPVANNFNWELGHGYRLVWIKQQRLRYLTLSRGIRIEANFNGADNLGLITTVFFSHTRSTWGTRPVPLDMKGCICHFTKWQIHPFISKGSKCTPHISRRFQAGQKWSLSQTCSCERPLTACGHSQIVAILKWRVT